MAKGRTAHQRKVCGLRQERDAILCVAMAQLAVLAPAEGVDDALCICCDAVAPTAGHGDNLDILDAQHLQSKLRISGHEHVLEPYIKAPAITALSTACTCFTSFGMNSSRLSHQGQLSSGQHSSGATEAAVALEDNQSACVH